MSTMGRRVGLAVPVSLVAHAGIVTVLGVVGGSERPMDPPVDAVASQVEFATLVPSLPMVVEVPAEDTPALVGLAPEPLARRSATSSQMRPRRARSRSTDRSRATAPQSPVAVVEEDAPAPGLPSWIRDNISGSEFLSDSVVEEAYVLSAPIESESHADGTLSFRGDGIEGCRYPGGAVQTRADTGQGDPCCHAESIDECPCLQEDGDPAARARVIRQLP